ncbi:MAG: hypothetical protein ACTHXA_06165 [Gulosibacter sp.]|uniref:hypothetical protein n=1 Tax=Gulosibacter sp. TaxID=2817531 RepID=UPI003F914F06
MTNNEGASRSGLPWEDRDYRAIIAAIGEGANDIDEVARYTGRTTSSIMSKWRRLLPIEQRTAPRDRVIPLLRGHLEDPNYDWQLATITDPPPPPIVRPPAKTGLPGLELEDLEDIGFAVGLSAVVMPDVLRERLGVEIVTRNLQHRIRDRRVEQLLTSPGSVISVAAAEAEANTWISRVYASVSRYAGALRPYRSEWDYGHSVREYDEPWTTAHALGNGAVEVVEPVDEYRSAIGDEPQF